MAQRLGIAAVLLGDPGVLLLDEPVNGLDPEGIRWIRGLLRSLAAEGRAVLVSSHLISEMALMADHLVVIGRGRLLADTTAAELAARASTLEEAFLQHPRPARRMTHGRCPGAALYRLAEHRTAAPGPRSGGPAGRPLALALADIC